MPITFKTIRDYLTTVCFSNTLYLRKHPDEIPYNIVEYYTYKPHSMEELYEIEEKSYYKKLKKLRLDFSTYCMENNIIYSVKMFQELFDFDFYSYLDKLHPDDVVYPMNQESIDFTKCFETFFEVMYPDIWRDITDIDISPNITK